MCLTHLQATTMRIARTLSVRADLCRSTDRTYNRNNVCGQDDKRHTEMLLSSDRVLSRLVTPLGILPTKAVSRRMLQEVSTHVGNQLNGLGPCK